MTNFTIEDLRGLSIAFLLFPPFIILPGYMFAWWGNIINFKKRRLETRILISIILSISTTPVLNYLVAKILPFDIVVWCYFPIWVSFLYHCYSHRELFKININRWERLAIFLTLVWLVIASCSLIDIKIGQNLYYNIISYDHATRIALTDSIARSGIPAINPNFFPGEAIPVSYFYFWPLTCALISKLTGQFLDGRISFFAGILWIGIALRAMAAIYIRCFYPGKQINVSSRIAVATGLFFVTGLDILFEWIVMIQNPGNAFATEWWNGNAQVTAWTGATFWVPHHVASLVSCLTSFVILKSIKEETTLKNKIVGVLFTGLGFASSFGMSVYVTLIFVITLGIWLFISLLNKQHRYKIIWILGSGIVAISLSIPFIIEIISTQKYLGSDFPIAVWVRSFEPVKLFAVSHEWNKVFTNIIYLITLPINYLFEFGFFIVASSIYLAQKRNRIQNKVHITPDVILLVCSFIVSTFFRSTTISNNDLGWRGLMPAQFLLLVWSVEVITSIYPKYFNRNYPIQIGSLFTKQLIIILLTIGLMSTFTDLFYLRFYYVINDFTAWFPVPAEGRPDRQVGKRTQALREIYESINTTYPENITIENNPNLRVLDRAQGLYSHRQIVADGPGTGVEVYGVSRVEYDTLAKQIYPLFESTNFSADDAKSLCKKLYISLLIIKDTDPVWVNPNSWIWQITPIFHNNFVRVIQCN